MVTRWSVVMVILCVWGCGDDRLDGFQGDVEAFEDGIPAGVESNTPVCGSPAVEVFSQGICVCEDFVQVGKLVVGPAEGETEDAAVAVNGESSMAADGELGGSFVAYGGLSAAARLQVSKDLRSAGSVGFAGLVRVGRDMFVGGSLTGFGPLEVGGSLGVAGQNLNLGPQDVGGSTSFQPLDGPPCGCGADMLLDVRVAVAEAALDNDNNSIGMPDSWSGIGLSVLELPEGRYYLDDFQSLGATRIRVLGEVSLFVGDDFDVVGDQRFEIAEGAKLDLYVAGSVRSVGNLSLPASTPTAGFNLFIGGEDEVSVSVGRQIFRGSIYAPRAPLSTVGQTVIEGSLFARRFGDIGNLRVGYMRPRPAPAESCDRANEIGR